MAPSERFVFNLNSKEELKRWHLYSDSFYGGCINSSICSYLNLVTVLMLLRLKISLDCIILLFYTELHSDGIYTENWVNSPEQQEDNSWQALCCHSQGSLAYCEGNLQISLDRYLLTWRGNVISTMLE
ncbi:unnamed protein product, partial [Musa textilis]